MKDWKAFEKQHWDNVAHHWQKWHDMLESGGRTITEALLDMAKVSPGQWVLDVATGIGEPACTAAARVGADGKVVGIDLAPRMIQLAEKRAKALGLTNVSFHVQDAEQLATSSAGSYEVALSRLGLMLMPNVGAALKGVRHVLTGGARFAAAVWAARPKAQFLGVALDVIEEVLAPEPPPPGAPGAFALAEPGLLEKRMTEAGFREVVAERVTTTFEVPSAEDYAAFVKEVASIAEVVKKAPTDVQTEVWQKVTEAAKGLSDPDGKVALLAEVLVVGGRK